MDAVAEHRKHGPRSVRFAVLSASDSRAEADDESGALIAKLAARAGHEVVARSVIADEAERIRRAVVGAIAERGADVVVLTGGTGFSPRDVSVEAVSPLFQRQVEGFGEIFRALSYEQVGAAAMLSRAVAGVIHQSVVFVVPGSPKAVELAMSSLILPEASHLLGQLRR